MNTNPSALPPTSSLKSPEPIKLTSAEVRLNELSQMAINGTYAPGVTAKDLATAKRKVYMERVHEWEDDYEDWPSGGESILHEAARSGHYPPDTTLELLAETEDATRKSALSVALLMRRDYGIPLPHCCTAPALAMLKPRFGQPTWLHYAATCGFTPPDTTPELLINTVHNGWTALHAAAKNGNLIPGITLRMLKCTVAPVTIFGDLNFSALEEFKKLVDRELGWLSEGNHPLSKEIINSMKNLMQSSVASVPNLDSLAEVRNLANVFQKIAPVETARWFAAELVGHHQKLINDRDAS